MTDPAPAVVIGLDCITGLQSARILARRGVPVIGLAGDARHYAARTRVCERVIEADLTGEGLIESLERLGPSLPSRAVLFPCTDLSVLLVSRHRERLMDRYHVLLPDHAAVQTLMDKMRFLQHAIDHDLPIPETVLLRDRGDALRAADTLTYPCVLKPPVKSPTWQRNTAMKVFLVGTPEELIATYDRIGGWAEVIIAQEWVEGGEQELYSCNAYFDRQARPLVTFVARKLRQWPPHTGTSSLGEECRNDDVLDATVGLFAGVGFHGLAYLEMKRDVRSGRHYIIEPNVGRPTGRSAIADGAGVPLLYTAYCDAVGLPLPAGREQRYSGAKWIDIRRDTQSALYFLRRGELSWRGWAASVRGPKAHAVLDRTDPLPFLYELLQITGKALRAARPRRASTGHRPTTVLPPVVGRR